MTPSQLRSLGYRSLGWSNQHQSNPSFWTRYRSLTWETVSTSPGYTLEVCHETKEFLETDSSN